MPPVAQLSIFAPRRDTAAIADPNNNNKQCLDTLLATVFVNTGVAYYSSTPLAPSWMNRRVGQLGAAPL